MVLVSNSSTHSVQCMVGESALGTPDPVEEWQIPAVDLTCAACHQAGAVASPYVPIEGPLVVLVSMIRCRLDGL